MVGGVINNQWKSLVRAQQGFLAASTLIVDTLQYGNMELKMPGRVSQVWWRQRVDTQGTYLTIILPILHQTILGNLASMNDEWFWCSLVNTQASSPLTRDIAIGTVGPVSSGPLFGAPKLFLAHITIGTTTNRPVGTTTSGPVGTYGIYIKLQDRCENGHESYEKDSSWSSWQVPSSKPFNVTTYIALSCKMGYADYGQCKARPPLVLQALGLWKWKKDLQAPLLSLQWVIQLLS